MKTNKYELIMFDLDGTILDTVGDLQDSVNYALNRYGMPSRTTEEVLAFLGNGVNALMKRAVPDGTPEATTAACLADFKQHYESGGTPKTAPYPGMTDTLKALKAQGFKLAVVSNKYHEAAAPLIEHHFGGIFDMALGATDRFGSKPSPAACNEIMRVLNSAPDCTVLVGDTEVDATTAANAKVDFIAVTWGFRTQAVLGPFAPVFIAKAPQDILKAPKINID